MPRVNGKKLNAALTAQVDPPKTKRAVVAMTAKQCVEALQGRHSEDLTVPECKDGPTHGAAFCRLDLWVMTRSWKHPTLTGYEVKVSRGDFLGDQKWPGYLPLCNQLYFACPAGLLDPAEIPEQCGLVYCYLNPCRVITKKKAVHRAIAEPTQLFRYVLMCRSVMKQEWDGIDEDGATARKIRRAAEFRDYLDGRGSLRDLGYRVGKKLREAFTQLETGLQCENERLKRELSRFEELAVWLKENKIQINGWDVKRKVEQLATVIDPEIANRIEQAAEAINRLHQRVKQLQEQSPVKGAEEPLSNHNWQDEMKAGGEDEDDGDGPGTATEEPEVPVTASARSAPVDAPGPGRTGDGEPRDEADQQSPGEVPDGPSGGGPVVDRDRGGDHAADPGSVRGPGVDEEAGPSRDLGGLPGGEATPAPTKNKRPRPSSRGSRKLDTMKGQG